MTKILILCVLLAGCASVNRRTPFQECLVERAACGDLSAVERCVGKGGLDAFAQTCALDYSGGRYHTTVPVHACAGEPGMLACCEELDARLNEACAAAVSQ